MSKDQWNKQLRGAIAADSEVVITGRVTSEFGLCVQNLKGVIATISSGDDPAIKVWPFDNIGDGKLWFTPESTESLIVINED